MARIERAKLVTGQEVWYKYENYEGFLDGPFKVVKFFNDHTGRVVVLRRAVAGGAERNVSLAGDDEYGDPIFYDSNSI